MSEHASWKHTQQSFLEDELIRTFPEMVDLRACPVTQSCPALCDPIECSPPGSSVHGILRQEYCSELPFPSLGDLRNPGMEPDSSALQADSLRLSHLEAQAN